MKLKRLKFFYGSFIFKLPLISSYSGVVIGRWIFFKDKNPPQTLITHELVHQEQMDRHGVFGFYFKYAIDYIRLLFKYWNHKLAYYNIPFEIEAYLRENENKEEE